MLKQAARLTKSARLCLSVIGIVLACSAGGTLNAQESIEGTMAESKPAPEGQVIELAKTDFKRQEHTATLLKDGRVLLAGGSDATGILASAVLFDPETRTFTATGSLTVPREGHTATLLESGKVLIAGGSNASGALGSAELFDPETGKFASAGIMFAARCDHTATLLPDGRVLLAGGDAASGTPRTAEIYDPKANAAAAFVPTGAMASVRRGHTATLFNDRTIFLTGGYPESSASTAETYDIATGAFTLAPQQLKSARALHTAVLAEEKVDGVKQLKLVLFGGDTAGTVEEVDLSNLAAGAIIDDGLASDASATLLANDQILILSAKAAYVMDWAAKTRSTVAVSTALQRTGHTVTELTAADHKLLVAGGVDAENKYVSAAALFNPARLWTDKDDYLPDEPVIVYGAGWKANEEVDLYVKDSEGWEYDSTAVADANGEFTMDPYFVVLLRHLGVKFDLVAFGKNSGLRVDVAFTDGNFQAWQNKGTKSWTSSTLNSNNSQYKEGDTVPIRYAATLAAGSTNTVILKYDFTDSSGRHFFDSLGSYDASEKNLTEAQLIAPFTNLSKTTPSTLIPNDGSLPAGVQIGGEFTCYNVEIISVSPYETESTGQVKKVTITFKVTAGSGTKDVVIAYGGHLAKPSDWGAGKGASSLPGASRKAYLAEVPANGNLSFDNVGLNPDAIIPETSITVQPSTTVYGSGNTTLTATFLNLSTNTAVNGVTIDFTLGGSPVGSAPTDANGVATLTLTGNGSLAALAAGNYSNYVKANFAGTATLSASSNTGTLTVTKAPLTVTADNKSREYGATNPAFTASYSGFKNGETLATSGVTGAPSLTTTATATSGVGDYPITAAIGTLASGNYSFSFVNGMLTVSGKAVTVAADAKSKTYGDANPELTATVTGALPGDTLNYTLATTATTSSGVGGYPITVTLGNNPNYSVISIDSTLAVTAKAATVTANAKSKTYGAANPTLTAAETGVLPGDTLNYTLATTAVTGSGVGSYPITVTLGSNPNYSVTPTDSTLTVTAKAVTVKADAKSKTYGDANPALTAVVSGTLASDTLNYTLATTAVTGSGVGSYPITVTLGSNPNYSVTPTDSTLTVTAKAVTVKADAKSKTYGDANPALTAVVSGTLASDTLNYTLATTAVTGSGVGSYPITVTLGSNPNYSVTPTDSTLTVTAKAVTVKADAKSKTYGDANPALTAVVSGTLASDTLNYTLATTAVTGSGVGSYPITVTLGNNPNYSVTPTDSTLTVTKAELMVKANDASKTYGDANPAFTVNCTGFVNGDTVAKLSGTLIFDTAATASSGVGTYDVTPQGLTSGNYVISFAKGTLTIGTRAATIKANSKVIVYGNAVPALDAAISGAVNGDVLNYTLGTNAVAFSDAGAYAISVTLASNPNYVVTPSNGVLTITKAYQVIAWNNPADIGYSTPLSATQLNATVAGIPNGSAPGALTYNPGSGIVLNAGDNVLTVTAAETTNYYQATKQVHINVLAAPASVAYIGQTLFVTSGTSATTAQVTLSASIAAGIDETKGWILPSNAIATAKVNFYDISGGGRVLLAGNVPVSPVNGSPSTGTANKIVTLSTGKYGLQDYAIEVEVNGNFTNYQQLLPELGEGDPAYDAAHATVTVKIPSQKNSILGSGNFSPTATSAGQVGTGITSMVHFRNFALVYNKSMTNIQGAFDIYFDRINADGLKETVYIKTNAANSMNVTAYTSPTATKPSTATFYGKCNVNKVVHHPGDPANAINPWDESVAVDGGASLRLDVVDGGSAITNDKIAITVLGKNNSTLHYSNDWQYDAGIKGYKSILQGIASGVGLSIE